MAHYIIEKMADGMHGDREKLYPRLVMGETIGNNRLAAMIQSRTSFTRGDVLGMLTELADVAREIFANGNTLSIEGLGYLKPVLGLVDKEERGAWVDASDRATTRRNVKLKTITFNPDKKFLVKTGRDLDKHLQCVNNGAVTGKVPNVPPIEERIALALAYIDENGFMRVSDYAKLTHQPKSTASKELRELAEDVNSGIASSGTGAAKIYLRRK